MGLLLPLYEMALLVGTSSAHSIEAAGGGHATACCGALYRHVDTHEYITRGFRLYCCIHMHLPVLLYG